MTGEVVESPREVETKEAAPKEAGNTQIAQNVFQF